MNNESRTWTQAELDFEKSRLEWFIKNEEAALQSHKEKLEQLKQDTVDRSERKIMLYRKKLELLKDALVVHRM